MTTFEDYFKLRCPHRPAVRSANSTALIGEGIEFFTFDVILSDEPTHPVRINDMIYRPSTCCSLFLWHVICKMVVNMVAKGRKIKVWKQNDRICEVEMNGN